jgi:hypothetical protein
MKTYTSELELLRDEVEKCHKIIENQIQMLKDAMAARHVKHPWVELTEDDAIELLPVGDWDVEPTLEFFQAVQQALKEKNHD